MSDELMIVQAADIFTNVLHWILFWKLMVKSTETLRFWDKEMAIKLSNPLVAVVEFRTLYVLKDMWRY